MPAKPSAVIDTRVIYCGDNLEHFSKIPAERFISRRKSAAFEHRHESTRA